jgi:hypothetical protein
MLIRKNLQFIKGLSKMLISKVRYFGDNMLIRNNLQFIHGLSPTNCQRLTPSLLPGLP